MKDYTKYKCFHCNFISALENFQDTEYDGDVLGTCPKCGKNGVIVGVEDSAFKCSIKNFQSISNVDFDFHEGLNIIVGPNNEGKSACLRAIEQVILNKVDDSKIKLSQDSIEVVIDYLDYNVKFTRCRKPKSGQSKTNYWINNVLYTKVGKGQFDDISSIFNFKEIKVNEKKYSLNFWAQFELPFLISQSNSKIFEFLSSASSENSLIEVVRTMKTDLDTYGKDVSKQDVKVSLLKDELDENQIFLEKMIGFDLVYDSIIGFESKLNDLELLKDIIAKSKSYSSRVSTEQDRLDNLNNVAKCYKESNLENIYTDVEYLDRLISNTASFNIKFSRYKDILNKASDIQSTFQSTCVEEKYKGLAKLSLVVAAVADLSIQRDKYTDSINKYNKFITEMSGVESLYEKYLSISSSYSSLNELVSANSKISKNLNKLSSDITVYNDERSLLDSELSKFKVCPLCNKSLV
jgi:exonuclease SbcC